MPDDTFRALEGAIRSQQTKYFGKYRAFVADNTDPEGIARCRLTVPSVLGEAISDWAVPCMPYGGAADLGLLAVPPVGAQVLAEFLEGDLSSPIWTGTFWRSSDELPSEYTDVGGPDMKVLKTESGHVLSFNDTEGGEEVILKSTAGAEVKLDPEGSILLTDSAGATVTLDAAGGSVTVADANGNAMVMEAAGITCTDANGKEIRTSGSGVEVTASVKGTTFLSLCNTHTHTCTAPGSPTSPPMVPLTPTVLTTKSTAQ